MNRTIPDYQIYAKATVNGVPVQDILIHKDWHHAAYAAQSAIPEGAAEYTVQLTNPETNESRTYQVKGWYEFKKSARELRNKRVIR